MNFNIFAKNLLREAEEETPTITAKTDPNHLVDFPFVNKANHTSRKIVALTHFLNMKHGPWIAGGSLRRILDGQIDSPHDIDVFFSSEKQYDRWSVTLNEFDISYQLAHPDEYVPQFQCVKARYYNSALALIENIDFTICKFVTDGRTIRCPHTSLNDLAEKRLDMDPLHASRVRSIDRFFRYTEYGFHPTPTVLDQAEIMEENFYGVLKCSVEVPQIHDWETLQFACMMSRIGDIHITKIDGKYWGCIFGFPFPLRSGYVYLKTADQRSLIQLDMETLWTTLGIDQADLKKVSGQLTALAPRYIEMYKSLIAK